MCSLDISRADPATFIGFLDIYISLYTPGYASLSVAHSRFGVSFQFQSDKIVAQRCRISAFLARLELECREIEMWYSDETP